MFVQREDNISKETIEDMEKLLLGHFLWIKRPMQFLFLWPLQNKSKQSSGRFLLILYFFVSLVCMGLTLMSEINKVDVNGSMVVKFLFSISNFSLVIFLYAHLIINYGKIIAIMTQLTKVFKNHDEQAKQIIVKTVNHSLFISRIQIVAAILLFNVTTIIFPVLKPICLSWIFPKHQQPKSSLQYNMLYFLDENEFFYAILSFNILLSTICFILFTLVSFFLWLISGFTVGSLVCFQLFDHLCSFASPTLLLTLAANGFNVIMLGTWIVILLEKDSQESYYMLSLFFTIMVGVVNECIPSQLMSNAGYEFFNYCYSINWYNYSPKSRLALELLMNRAMKISALQGGPIFILNLELFSKIFNSSVSFMATFRSLYISH